LMIEQLFSNFIFIFFFENEAGLKEVR